jgi:hypothetical protein
MGSNYGAQYVFPASGYYTAGSIIHISATEPLITTTPPYGLCFEWSGNGPGSYTGNAVQANIVMNGNINETAVFSSCLLTTTTTSTVYPTYPNEINMSLFQNATSGAWRVQFQSFVTNSGASATNLPLVFGVFYNGQEVNRSIIQPGQSILFNQNGNLLRLNLISDYNPGAAASNFYTGGSRAVIVLNTTAASTTTTSTIPQTGSYCTPPPAGPAPLIVCDSYANPGENYILIGNGYENILTAQLDSAYNISPRFFNIPVVQAYGPNRILLAGNSSNQTITAENEFITQLKTATGNGSPVIFENVPVISNNCEPVIQVVVGSKGTEAEYLAAQNVANEILSLAKNCAAHTTVTTTVPGSNLTTMFTESGLPAGALFTITYANLTKSVSVVPNSDAILYFSTPPGDYGYTLYGTTYNTKIYNPTGQVPSGYFNPGTSVVIYFTQSSTSTTTILPTNQTSVTFVEVGLPKGANFTVSLGHMTKTIFASTSNAITFYTNGSTQLTYALFGSYFAGYEYTPHGSGPSLQSPYVTVTYTRSNSTVSTTAPTSTILINLTTYTTTVPQTNSSGVSPYNVGTYSPTSGTTVINIVKGWNIIPDTGLTTAQLAGCQQDYGAHYFIYSPSSHSYLNYGEASSLSSSQGSYISPYTGWFYSTANCNIVYNISQDNQQYQPTANLAAGWNFFTVKPWMLNETYGTEFGNCNVTQVARWNASSQQWSSIGGSVSPGEMTFFDQMRITASMIESSMLLKVPRSCSLQTEVTAIPTPPVPPSSLW